MGTKTTNLLAVMGVGLGVAFLLVASTAHATMILNGDIENNTAVGTMFNMTNATFNATVADATAFGGSDEINLVTGTDFGVAPQSGDWKLGLHTQGTLAVDAFSFDLSTVIVSGSTYDLQFFAAGQPDFGPALGPVEIGISNSATAFGTLIFSGTPVSTSAWTQFDYNFVAPVNGSFLTVRSSSTVSNIYAFVDNFSLAPIPEPTAPLLFGTGMLVAGMALRRRTA